VQTPILLRSAFAALVGPAAVMAAGTMGAGAMAAFLLAGAWFGYSLLWVIPLMLPVFVVSADSASRIGALNPKRGLFSLIAAYLGRPLAWFILVIVVPVHFLVCMGQLSVMASATESLFGFSADSAAMQLFLCCGLAAITLWLVLSRGYERMQSAMTLLMLLMFLCFLLVALRGLSQWSAILGGLRPAIPDALTLAGGAERRAEASIIAMVGSAIAPAALLGLPYLSADAGGGRQALDAGFRRAILNLGVVFGAYAVLVLIAGAFALHARPDFAEFADVGQAGEVLRAVFPGALAPLGPKVFALGLLMAAMTTLVVAAQVTLYFVLDMSGLPWRFSADNARFRLGLAAFVLGAAVLAPFWEFPALLKVILLMGINVVVMPVVYLIVLVLANRRAVMQDVPTPWWRNLLLLAGLLASLFLAVDRAPQYLAMLAGVLR
jgi:Mn2+/Fe2+ NRAMP family transporter